jgi:hypothetical protein
MRLRLINVEKSTILQIGQGNFKKKKNQKEENEAKRNLCTKGGKK